MIYISVCNDVLQALPWSNDRARDSALEAWRARVPAGRIGGGGPSSSWAAADLEIGPPLRPHREPGPQGRGPSSKQLVETTRPTFISTSPVIVNGCTGLGLARSVAMPVISRLSPEVLSFSVQQSQGRPCNPATVALR